MADDREHGQAERTSRATSAEGDATDAVFRMIDLIARRTAEQYAEGEFRDAPKLSRRARPQKRQ